MTTPRSRHVRTALRSLVGALLVSFLSTACQSEVAFYEKQALADEVMNMSEQPLETHWFAKLFFSLEGSIGGIGTSGGGGCGCY